MSCVPCARFSPFRVSKNHPSDPEFVNLLIDSQEMLRCFVLSLLPNHPDVRDVLQEINIVLWEKRRSFELGTSFTNWACTVARFKALNELRKMKRAKRLVFNDELIDALAEKSSGEPSDMLESQRGALKYCMEKLRPSDHELLLARYTSHHEWERFALESDRSRPSLRVSLGRLRAALRRCIRQRLAMEGRQA